MERIMTYETLRNFAYVNDKICKNGINGIVISFFGLNGCAMFDEDIPEGIYYAEKGILYVVPYNNPWAWMNQQAVDYTDEVLDVLVAKYGLPDDIPIVSTGGSMGGQSALVYTRYAKRTPIACVANCPVCDLVYHYTERPDLPHTLYSAFYNYNGSIQDAMKTASPLHLVYQMPRVSYHIFHCTKDEAVNINSHSEKLVEAMRDMQYDVTFDIVEGRGHCDLTEEMRELYARYCVQEIENAGR